MAIATDDELLKKRIERARAQGMAEEDIQRHALIEKTLSRQKQLQQPQQTAQPAKQKKVGGVKRGLINAGALVAGAGAGVGAIALAPVTGGASLAGGFAAGAGIEALRRRALGEKQSLKASALEGGLTLLPGAGKAIKGIKGAATGAKTLAVEKNAVENITKEALRKRSQGIPVKYTTETATGKATPQTANKLLINPSVGEVKNAATELTSKGYKVKGTAKQKYGGSTSGDTTPTPVVKMQGTRTSVKFGDSTTEKGVINTPNKYEKVKTEAPTVTSPEKEGLKATLLGAFKTPDGGGRVSKAGDSMRANQRGIRPGEKLVNSIKEKPLDTARSAEINSAINQANKGVLPKGVRGQLVNVQKEKDKAAQLLNQKAKESKAVVTPETTKVVEGVVGGGRSKILKFDPKNPAHIKINNDYAERLSKAKNPEQLLAVRRIFDKTANATFNNPSVEQAIDKELAGVYRTAADKAIANIAPELKPLDKKFSTFLQAEKGLTNKTQKLNPSGFKPFGTSVNGQGFGGGALQASKEGLGKTLQATGKVTANPVVKAGVRQQVGRMLTKPYLDAPTDQATPENPQDLLAGSQAPDEQLLNEAVKQGMTDPQQMYDLLSGQGDFAALTENPQENPLGASSSDLFKQALDLRLAGDAKGSKDILEFAKVAAEFEKGAGSASAITGGPNITKVTAQQYGLAQSGQGALDKLKALLQSDPGVLDRARTPGRSISALGIGGTISNAVGTGDFDAVGYNIADSILRLRTGATANESEVKKLQSQIMPRPGDSQQTIDTKIKQIEQIFGGVLSVASNQPSGGDFGDITNLLNNQQQGY